jgi:hypothetical protein
MHPNSYKGIEVPDNVYESILRYLIQEVLKKQEIGLQQADQNTPQVNIASPGKSSGKGLE